MHDSRLSLAHLNSCLQSVESKSNFDISRLLRIALKTEDVSDILTYFVHIINERMTTRGEQFGTTDEDI
jgi:hypothetical protein